MMLSMRDHDVDDYAALRGMDATDVGVLTQDDRDCLNELGPYLVSTDAWQRFAIWLLHKHFEPEAEEVFVERAITSPPQTHTTPIPRAAFSLSGLNATAMRFDTEVASGVGLVGMEFAGPADFGPAAPISPADEAVLAGLATRLQSHGKIGRFGGGCSATSWACPTTRCYWKPATPPGAPCTAQVMERTNIPTKTIETTWQWKPVITKTGPTPTMDCSIECAVSMCAYDDTGHLLVPSFHTTTHT